MLNQINDIELINYHPLTKSYSPAIKSILLSSRYERNFKKEAINYLTTANILFF